ncbi:hypothetical protein JCM5353_007774 [Sporobolomyces roseus]
MLSSGLRIAAFLTLIPVLVSSQSTSTTVEGSLTDGPISQGNCVRLQSRIDTFDCSTGTKCTWRSDSLDFACSTTADPSTGPPGRVCVASRELWSCDDGFSYLGEYDLNLHIVALFVVLVGSLVGVMLPVVCFSILQGRVFRAVFFAIKHFGTGVIVSTAFIHLLFHGFTMFSNACLGDLAFEPAAAAIALSGVYIVFSVDFFVMRWLRSRSERRSAALAVANADGPMRLIGSEAEVEKKRPNDLAHSHGAGRDLGDTDYSSSQARFDVFILEAGMIFHSVMIGVSLGASSGDDFLPLFVAIVFHQVFEGLALGSRIGQLVWPQGQWAKKWVMCAMFGVITPVGMAIGMAVHGTYNPNSGASILSVGVLDSISAGILIYGGLVECLYHDFMHSSLARAKSRTVFLAFFFLLAGTICMSVIGHWA